MKATNEKKAEGYSSPYDFEGRIPLSQAIPLGLQHVMAMFIGNLTPLIIVMGVCGLTADAGFGELRTALLQNAMIIRLELLHWFRCFPSVRSEEKCRLLWERHPDFSEF